MSSRLRSRLPRHRAPSSLAPRSGERAASAASRVRSHMGADVPGRASSVARLPLELRPGPEPGPAPGLGGPHLSPTCICRERGRGRRRGRRRGRDFSPTPSTSTSRPTDRHGPEVRAHLGAEFRRSCTSHGPKVDAVVHNRVAAAAAAGAALRAAWRAWDKRAHLDGGVVVDVVGFCPAVSPSHPPARRGLGRPRPPLRRVGP